MKHSIFLVLLALIFAFVNCYSQEPYAEEGIIENSIDTMAFKPKYGGFIHYNLNIHSADFPRFKGVPSCCPQFTSGNGTGFSFGLLMDLPVTDDVVLNFRAGYSIFNGLLKKREATYVIVDGLSRLGAFEHQLDTRLSSIAIEPTAGYKIFNNFYAHGGMRLGLITNSHFTYKEEIVDPPDRGVFEVEGTRIRNDTSGNIPEVSSFQMSFIAGLSYELPLDRKGSLYFAPEIYYNFWFTPVAADKSWYIHTVRIGAAFKYRQPPPPPPPPPPPLPPPFPPMQTVEPPSSLTVSVKAVQLDSNNEEKSNFDLRIEDFISHNMRPLLNYIFFDENSAQIPSRYKLLTPGQADRFTMKQLENIDIMQTYYHVLNIIGHRLSENTNAKVTIVGTNCNIGVEKGNHDLSMQRALTVKNYLQNVWGVSPEQLTVQARNLPDEPSNINEPGGEEENRRVEIISDSWAIVEPVLTVDTLRKISTSNIRFYPKARSETAIKSWELVAKQNNRELLKFEGGSEVPQQLNWKITEKDSSAPNRGGQISYIFTAKDEFGQTASTAKQSLPVEQITIDKKRLERISDKEFEYYSLILFDYGKDRLGKGHQNVLDFVTDRVTPESSVLITGHTDSMGDEEINKRIATKRALAVAGRLKIPNAKVEGIGESDLLYDNKLPEGRFYCRTVRITIETPVKNGR